MTTDDLDKADAMAVTTQADLGASIHSQPQSVAPNSQSVAPNSQSVAPNFMVKTAILLGFILCAIVGVIIVLSPHNNKAHLKSHSGVNAAPLIPHARYLAITSEPHTGLRLARLRDFAQNMQPNADTEHAKLAAESLAVQEQKAWALLSNARYDLRKTEAQKQDALQAYIEVWGAWSRADQLDVITGTSIQESKTTNADTERLANYAPNRNRSKFANSPDPDTLAGAVPTVVYTPPPIHKPIVQPKLQPVQLRVKYAKKPRYPKRARRRGIEAKVTLALDIDERGRVARAHVVNVSAARYEKDFIRAARRAALGSKFYPQTKDGHPIAIAKYSREYTFVRGDDFIATPFNQ